MMPLPWHLMHMSLLVPLEIRLKNLIEWNSQFKKNTKINSELPWIARFFFRISVAYKSFSSATSKDFNPAFAFNITPYFNLGLSIIITKFSISTKYLKESNLHLQRSKEFRVLDGFPHFGIFFCGFFSEPRRKDWWFFLNFSRKLSIASWWFIIEWYLNSITVGNPRLVYSWFDFSLRITIDECICHLEKNNTEPIAEVPRLQFPYSQDKIIEANC